MPMFRALAIANSSSSTQNGASFIRIDAFCLHGIACFPTCVLFASVADIARHASPAMRRGEITLRESCYQVCDRTAASDRKLLPQGFLERHGGEEWCAWLPAAQPINLTSVDTELIGVRPQRHDLRLGPPVKIVREEDDIETCAMDLRGLGGFKSRDLLQLYIRPYEHWHGVPQSLPESPLDLLFERADIFGFPRIVRCHS